VRKAVVACLVATLLLSAYSAFEMHSLLIGNAGGEIELGALAASAFATVSAASAISICIGRRRELPTAYFAGSLMVASFSLLVGIWVWIAA
jgi:hypothetical protein